MAGTVEEKTQLLNTKTQAAWNTSVPKPHSVGRQWTDLIWLAIFIVCCGGLGYLMFDAFKNGDPRRLYHVRNYQGQLCGVDLPQKPFGYWCTNPGVGGATSYATNGDTIKSGQELTAASMLGLDMWHPICLETCPTTDYGTSECYDPANGGTRAVQDYATHAIAGRYCLPQPGTGYLSKVMGEYDHNKLAQYVEEAVANVKKGWKLLLIAFGMAFVLSYLYILFLECCAGCVVYSCLVLAFLASAGVGGTILVKQAQGEGGLDGIPHSGDAKTNWIVGICLCVVSLGIVCFCCCYRKAIAVCVKATETTAVFLVHSPSMFIEPLLNLLARICIWIAMMIGFAYLMSTMEAGSDVVHTFDIPWHKALAIGFYIVMCIWLNEICTTMSQFVIANAAGRWYFTEHDPATGMKNVLTDRRCGCNCCLICSSYCSAITHLGSLAKGGLVIGLGRPVHCLVWFLSGCGLCKICGCCDWLLVYTSKTGIIELAVNPDTTATGFCSACKIAIEQISNTKNRFHLAEIESYHGATLVFTVLGMACVGAGCAAMTVIVVLNAGPWNDPLSVDYIQDPACLGMIAGFSGAVIAWCFMLLFDIAWDALLLCMCYDLHERADNKPPEYYEEAMEPPAKTTFLSSLMCTRSQPTKKVPIQPPVYAHAQMEEMFTGKPAGQLKNNSLGSFVNTSVRSVK